MILNQKYINKELSINYRWNISDIIRLKAKDNVKIH